MARSKITLLKAIGVCYIVLTNYYEPYFICIPIQSFLVACFFFILGYSFKPAFTFVDKLNSVKEKAELYMFLYFVYNISFALVRVFINTFLETKIMGPNPTFFNFFVEPLFQNRIYPISGSTWFYPQLYWTIVLVQLIYYNKQRNIYIDVAYLIGSIILFVVIMEFFSSKSPVQVILIRTLYSIIFTFLGYIYCQHLEEQKDSKFLTPLNCFISLSVLTWIMNIYPDIKYNYVKGDFHQHPFWVPLVTGCVGIYLHLYLCHALKHVVNVNDHLYTVAKETYHIMFLHGLSFTVINYVVVKCLFNVDDRVLDVSYRYRPNMTWPFFFVGGIGMPILFIKFVRLLKDVFYRQLK
jgi:hypothetical protein